MTVKELIHKLSSLPSEMQDLEVTALDEGYDRPVEITTAEDLYKDHPPWYSNLDDPSLPDCLKGTRSSIFPWTKEQSDSYNVSQLRLRTPNRVIL